MRREETAPILKTSTFVTANSTNCFPHATAINPSIHIRKQAGRPALPPPPSSLSSASSSPPLVCPMIAFVHAMPLCVCVCVCVCVFDDFIGEFRHFGEICRPLHSKSTESVVSLPRSAFSPRRRRVNESMSVLEPSIVNCDRASAWPVCYIIDVSPPLVAPAALHCRGG